MRNLRGKRDTAQSSVVKTYRERFTRTDDKTMKYEVTIDDPGAYTRPWSAGFLLGWDEGQELFE
jgi:hypothetical protein